MRVEFVCPQFNVVTRQTALEATSYIIYLTVSKNSHNNAKNILATISNRTQPTGEP